MMTTLRRGVIVKGMLAVVVAVAAAAPVRGQTQFSQAVSQLAADLADVVSPTGESLVTVRPAFGGVAGLGGGAGDGFSSLFRDSLVARGLAPDPEAPLTFVVRLDPVLDDRPPRAYLVGTLTGPGQPREGRIIRGRWMLDDAAELAQWAGISADLPRRPRRAQGAGFRRAIDNDTIFVSPERHRLYESAEGRFGLAVGVGPIAREGGRLRGRGRLLTIQEQAADGPPALGVVHVRKGDVFYVELVNDEPYEVAVELAIDGLNSFHYSSARKPDGSPYRYHVIAPQSSVVVGGWEQGDGSLDRRFEVASAAESQAAREGLGVESIGLITATVHACWKLGSSPPADEPESRESDELVYAIQKTVPETRTRRLADGTEKTYTVSVPLTATKSRSVGTKFGESFEQSLTGVERLIGVPRAVLAMRYEEAP